MGFGRLLGLVALLAVPVALGSDPWLWARVMAIGGGSLPLYSLSVAHTNDHLDPQQMVAASATVVLVQGIGLSFGPVLAAGTMQALGPHGLFVVLFAAHAVIGGFGIYRMTRSPPVPLDDQREYPTAPPRTSPVLAAVSARTVSDHRDRDLARWSRG